MSVATNQLHVLQTNAPLRALLLEKFMFLSSVFFILGAYYALLYLQSSINIEDGLGKLNMATICETILYLGKAGLRKCGARLEVILKSPTQWCVQKFLRSIRS